jgi:hypothetical protein
MVRSITGHAYQTRPGQPRQRVQLCSVRPSKVDVNSRNMASTAEENAHHMKRTP